MRRACPPAPAVPSGRSARAGRRSRSIQRATSGVVERSTDDASSSSTSLRLCFTRGESVCTTIPSSAAREHDGASTRAPSTSTTHTRQAFTGCSVSRKQSVGTSMPALWQAVSSVAPSRTVTFCPSIVTFTVRVDVRRL